MPTFEVVSPDGTKYRVNAPDGATQDDAIAYVQSNFSGEQKSAEPLQRRQPTAIEPETMTDRAALAADKVLSSLGSALPDWLPSRQNLVNVAAGMVPGFLEDAPRIKNVATEDGWRTAGRMLKPAETLLGLKAAQTALALPKIAAASGLTKSVTAGAAGGGVGGALSEDPLTGAATGAVLGGVLGALFRPIEKGADILHDLAATWKAGEKGQVTKWLHQIIPDPQLRKQAVQELDALSAIVTGEKVTSGLAAVSGNQPIPVLKAIEEQARRSPQIAHKFAAADAVSEAARVRPFESIAAVGEKPVAGMGERVGLSRAEATRKTMTDPLYEQAKKEVVPVDEQLRTLLGGDLVQAPLGRANAVVDQQITNALAAGRTPVVTGITGGRKVAGYDLPEWAMAPRTPDVIEPARVSIGAIQQFKKELDKDISALANATDGAGLAKLRELKDARTQVNKWMRDKSSTMASADDTFREASQFQNQADIAAVLRDALRGASGNERSGVLLNAMRDAPRTLNKADANSSIEQISQVFSPVQMRQANQVVDSLKRQEAYKALQAPNLPAMKSPSEEVLDVIPAIISRPIAFLRKALGKAGAVTDSAAQKLLNEAALDPKKLSALIDDLPPNEKDEVIKWIRQNRGGLLGGDVSLLMSNMLTPKEQRGLLDQ